MIQFTIFNSIGLLIDLIVVTFCWIFLVKNYRAFKKIDLKNLKSKQNVITDFSIGFGSGLMVFVLGWFANNMALIKADFSSISNFLFSVFVGSMTLFFQISIVFALLSWILLITFNKLK